MTTVFNNRRWLLFCGAVFLMISCNNSTETKKEADATTTDTTKAVAPAPAAFTPFDVIEVSHKVKDYGKWKPYYQTDSVNRKAAGLHDIVIARQQGDSNMIELVMMVDNVDSAKKMTGDAKLKATMDKAGVISKPTFEYFHVIRYNAQSKEKQWVEVTHKVKDFAAWLKVYDGEGPAAREAQGLYDIVLSRGIPDSNVVQLVFDIKDMAKAKASIMSDEKKKLMQSAGVEGQPTIKFYKEGE